MYRFVMEVHLVHYRSDFTSVTQAMESGERNALTVIAVFFYVMAEISSIAYKYTYIVTALIALVVLIIYIYSSILTTWITKGFLLLSVG